MVFPFPPHKQIPGSELESTPCAPGTGGAQCTTCAHGFFSPGGDKSTPRPECVACPNGFTTKSAAAISNSACAEKVCGPGSGGGSCSACARGFYSAGGDLTNPSPACLSCPAKISTSRAESTHASACSVPICDPGTGGPACKSCTYGTYSAGGSAYWPTPDCVRCASRGYTTYMGARSASDCINVSARNCLPGYSLSGGACHLCPKGTWSPGSTTTECNVCPGRSTTQGPGADSESQCALPASKSITLAGG